MLVTSALNVFKSNIVSKYLRKLSPNMQEESRMFRIVTKNNTYKNSAQREKNVQEKRK